MMFPEIFFLLNSIKHCTVLIQFIKFSIMLFVTLSIVALIFVVMILLHFCCRVADKRADEVLAFRASNDTNLFKKEFVVQAEKDVEKLDSAALQRAIDASEQEYQFYSSYGLSYCNRQEINHLVKSLLRAHFAREKLNLI